MSEQPHPRHHRPMLPGAGRFDAIADALDPAVRSEAADRCATLLVRGAHDTDDEGVVARVVHLADTEGLDTLADLWSGSPADSLAGCLWRLYVLRAWVYADPESAAREFDLGRPHSPVHEVVAGVSDPPRPADVQWLVDTVLRGIRVGDFADTLFRAAAFARVAAAGRVHRDREVVAGSSYASDVSASRLITLADQLERAAHLELAGTLG